MQINKRKLNKTIIAGDFNSNTIWDRWDRWWNHSDVIKELTELGIKSLYHKFKNEQQGKETSPTFYLHRKKNRPYHIDYILGSQDFSDKMTKFKIGNFEKWIQLSDHLPLICELDIKK